MEETLVNTFLFSPARDELLLIVYKNVKKNKDRKEVAESLVCFGDPPTM